MKKGIKFTYEQLQLLIEKYGKNAKIIDIIKDLENKQSKGLPNGRPIFMVIFRGTNIPPILVNHERNQARG